MVSSVIKFMVCVYVVVVLETLILAPYPPRKVLAYFHPQSAVVQPTPSAPQTTTTVSIPENTNAVVLKPQDSEASSYILRHSSTDPTLWIVDEVGNTASTHACNKNPLLPARKVGDYCVASFQVSIKNAVCYVDRKTLNTIRCTWPNSKEKN